MAHSRLATAPECEQHIFGQRSFRCDSEGNIDSGRVDRIDVAPPPRSPCPLLPWLASAALGGAPLAFAPAPGVVAATLTLALLARQAPAVAAASGAWLTLSAARARVAAHRGSAAYGAALQAVPGPARCDGLVELATSPTVRSGAPSGEAVGRSGEALAWPIELECVTETTGAVHTLPREAGLVRLHQAADGAGLDAARRGDRLKLHVRLAAVHAFDSEGSQSVAARLGRRAVTLSGEVLDAELVVEGRGPLAWVDRARAHVRARIDATFSPDAAALARALVLGESDLEPDDERAFRESGLSHLLAVSGTHLVVAVVALVRLLRAALARIPPLAARGDVGRWAAGAGVALAWLYADFAGRSGSAVRAAAMLSLAFAARALGRRPSGTRAFWLSLLGAGLVDPLALADASFAISVAATAGLLWLAPPLTKRASSLPGLLAPVARAMATTVAASAACAPLGAAMGGVVGVTTLFANVVAGPLGELAALPACLAHALSAPVPPLETLLARVGGGALVAVERLAHETAARPLGVVLPPPTDWQLAVLASSVAAWVLTPLARARVGCVAVGALLLAEGGAHWAGAPKGLLRVTALDVGQGDALLLDLPDGRALLLDAGGLVGSPVDTGERVVLRALAARRRRALDVVVASHPHPDHTLGLGAVLRALPVRELWDSGSGHHATDEAGPHDRLLALAEQRGARVRRPDELCGSHRFGEATIDVLAPCPGPEPDLGANDNSLVLKVSLGQRSFLLMGDAEREREAQLVARFGAGLRADVLKVGHHGSKTSTTGPFLDAVRPSYAMVSCGVRNRFGHPHPATLEALDRAGTSVLRTDRGGAIAIVTDGVSLWVRRGGASTWGPELLP